MVDALVIIGAVVACLVGVVINILIFKYFGVRPDDTTNISGGGDGDEVMMPMFLPMGARMAARQMARDSVEKNNKSE